NVLKSARVRREEYVGEWFPEPLLEDPYQDPQRSAELADSVSTAALVLLERLSPLERAAFVLRDVFGFDYTDIAAALGRSEAACRQLVVRARRHVRAGRPRFRVDRQEQQELATRFFEAIRTGDVDTLRTLLAADVQLVTDTGGNAPAPPRPIVGVENTVRVLASVLPQLGRVGLTLQPQQTNEEPGATGPRPARPPGAGDHPGHGRRPDPYDPFGEQPGQAHPSRSRGRPLAARPRLPRGPPAAPLTALPAPPAAVVMSQPEEPGCP